MTLRTPSTSGTRLARRLVTSATLVRDCRTWTHSETGRSKSEPHRLQSLQTSAQRNPTRSLPDASSQLTHFRWETNTNEAKIWVPRTMGRPRNCWREEQDGMRGGTYWIPAGRSCPFRILMLSPSSSGHSTKIAVQKKGIRNANAYDSTRWKAGLSSGDAGKLERQRSPRYAWSTRIVRRW